MNQYRVEKPMGSHAVGDILSESDFVSSRRARVLTDMRFISVVPVGPLELVKGTVQEVEGKISESTSVKDLNFIIDGDPRVGVKEAARKRLEALNGEQSH